ncbi:MAG: GntR family transcriptional regulator [Victivallaceae bacterium]|nr:GntR family transcriptional regulator [Victivallaceae bacterium]
MAKTNNFKYAQVEKLIDDYIQCNNLAPGSKLPPTRTLCREMKVGMVTLRHAISNLEQQNRLISHQGSGVYIPNPNREMFVESEIMHTVPGRRTIYIIDSFIKGEYKSRLADNYVIANWIDAARKACGAQRFGLKLLSFVYHEGAPYVVARLKKMDREKVGLLIVSLEFHDFLDELADCNIPTVILGTYDNKKTTQNIGSNLFEAGSLAGSYLAKLGHKNVMYVGVDPKTSKSSFDRHAGFCFAHQQIFPQNKIEQIFSQKVGFLNNYYSIFKAIASQVMAKIDSVSALFISSDYIAAVVVPYLLNHGVRIPQSVSLITLDDSHYCTMFTPQWTSVNTNHEIIAKTAVEMISNWEKVPSKSIPNPLEISPSLVVRESCLPKTGKLISNVRNMERPLKIINY